MVVMLHGCRQDADAFADLTRMNGIADRDNFLVLYPEQRRLANSMRCWNWYSRSAQTGAGEAAILADMIRSLADEYRVDTKRIFIAGLSAGAAMASNLSVCHADLFAACALHSGLAFGAASSSHTALQAMQEGARFDAHEMGRRAFIQARGKTGMMPAMVIHGDQDEVFGRRAREHSSLVIYDPSRRYRDIALAMTSEKCRVIDASQSVIEQREFATDALLNLADGQIHQLVVWVPAAVPADDEAKQRDPFAVFAEIGSMFPQGDGDDYASLCRQAKPDHIPEINRLFEEGEPSFEMVDALDEGGSWPKLKTLLGATSSKEILLGILSPKPEQDAALKTDAT